MPDRDDDERNDQRHRTLASGAQWCRADPAPEAVPPGAPTQVVQLVEVGILAEGRTDAPGEDGHLGRGRVFAVGPLPRGGHGVRRLEALVGETAEVGREPRAAPYLQPAHLGIGEEAVRRELAPQRRQLGKAAEVPAPGAGDGPGPVTIAGQHGDDDFTEGQECGLRQHSQQAEPGVALEDGAQLVAPLQRLHGDGVATLGLAGDHERLEPGGDHLAMAHPGVRSDHDTRARHLAAPREVEVFTHGDDPAVEALELREEIGPHQNAAAGGHEDVAHGVVLPVVELALSNAIHHGARLVATHPDVEEDAGVVPVDELRGHHPGVGAERLLDQLVHHIGVQRDVVVEEQEEGRSLHHAQGLVGGGGVPGSPRQPAHEGIGEHAGHPPHDLGIVLPGRQDEDRELLVILGRQRGKCLVEPGPGVRRDHDGDHGRHLGVHQGAEAIPFGIDPCRHEIHLECLLLFNTCDTVVHERSGPPAAPVSRTSA